jgi:hypothetical protein
MYMYAGAAYKAQDWIRKMGETDYNHTAGGLSGVSDLCLEADTVERRLRPNECLVLVLRLGVLPGYIISVYGL